MAWADANHGLHPYGPTSAGQSFIKEQDIILHSLQGDVANNDHRALMPASKNSGN